MITALKGSPQYTIDSEGLMTIATTWMVMPKEDTLTSVGWLAFQNEVEAFAGKPGDKYKKPKIVTGKEATDYEEVDTFRVDTVSWECMPGRTHYEVTFSNIQNLASMRMVGNVSVERNENNETTKTINYIIDVPASEDGTADPLAIDDYLIESGTSVNWAGTNYRVTNTNYNAQSANRYDVSITAVDMSVMMIGEPSVSIDGFGVRTASATWQYSTDAYLSAELPEAGDDATDYLGGLADYIIQNISVEPRGKAGYNITFNAIQVETKLTNISARRDTGSGTEYTYNYKTNRDEAEDFLSRLGTEFSDEGLGDTNATVSSVSIEEESRGNYNVTLTTKNDSNKSRDDTSKANLAKQVSASGSTATGVLTPRECGWATMVNGSGIYPINHPPTTTYSYPLEPAQYIASLVDSGTPTSITEQTMLSAIRTGAPIGYDRVVRVYDKDGKMVPNNKRTSIQSLSDVSRVIMQGFVYAQPTMTRPQDGKQTTFRNVYFEAWNPYEECPVMPQKRYINNFPEINGRWSYLDRKLVNKNIAVMEFSVTRNYKGNLASVLKKSWTTYFKDAIDYVRNDKQFTSYRCVSFNPSEITDDDGDAWTSIEIKIQALSGFYWNPRYSHDFAVYYVVNV